MVNILVQVFFLFCFFKFEHFVLTKSLLSILLSERRQVESEDKVSPPPKKKAQLEVISDHQSHTRGKWCCVGRGSYRDRSCRSDHGIHLFHVLFVPLQAVSMDDLEGTRTSPHSSAAWQKHWAKRIIRHNKSFFFFFTMFTFFFSTWWQSRYFDMHVA